MSHATSHAMSHAIRKLRSIPRLEVATGDQSNSDQQFVLLMFHEYSEFERIRGPDRPIPGHSFKLRTPLPVACGGIVPGNQGNGEPP